MRSALERGDKRDYQCNDDCTADGEDSVEEPYQPFSEFSLSFFERRRIAFQSPYSAPYFCSVNLLVLRLCCHM